MTSPPERRGPPRPPPMIGRAGNLTIFITPSYDPNPRPPPVQAPPMMLDVEGVSVNMLSSELSEFFWKAISKVQDVHSRLDSYLVDWFGLDDSKYQWALDNYYEHHEKVKEATKATKHKGDTRK